jgi:hypothetical protein
MGGGFRVRATAGGLCIVVYRRAECGPSASSRRLVDDGSTCTEPQLGVVSSMVLAATKFRRSCGRTLSGVERGPAPTFWP